MKTYNRRFQIKNYKRNLFTKVRIIPIGIKLKIWFGNPFTSMGLIFFVSGMISTGVFAPPSSFFSPSFNENDPVVNGKVIVAEGTNSYMNEVQVFKYTYIFNTIEGMQFSGIGYTTGDAHLIDVELLINYKKDDPSISEAEGLRHSPFGGGVAIFVWIFPLIGFGFLLVTIIKAIKQVRILKVGELAECKFLYKEATTTEINDQTIYKMYFEFTASDGKNYQTMTRTHQTHKLEDEEFEKLVYDPNEPSNVVFLDSLPNSLKNYFLQILQRDKAK